MKKKNLKTERELWSEMFAQAKEEERLAKVAKKKKTRRTIHYINAVMYMFGVIILSGAMYANVRYMWGFAAGIIACMLMFHIHYSLANGNEVSLE